MKLPTPFGIAVGYVDDRTSTLTTLTKHILWTFEEIFDIFVEHNRYAPGNVVVEITPDRLGVGNVMEAPIVPVSSLTTPAGVDFVSATLGSSNSSDGEISILDTESTMLVQTTDSNSTAQHIQSNDTFFEAAPVGARKKRDISIDFKFREHGATFTDAQIFNASLKLLIMAAEPPKHDSVGRSFSTYNDMDDFTFSVVAEQGLRGYALTWVDCINSIHGAVNMMSKQGAASEGKWGEIVGLIQNFRVNIGRFCIDRGDLTGFSPTALCSGAADHTSVSTLRA